MNKRKDQAESKTRGVDRRAFLRGVGLGAGAAGVAALVTTKTATAAAAPAEPEQKSAGYRETEHVRRAYELARF